MARILCYLHSFAGGGVERMALRLCRAWASDGMQVDLVVGRTEETACAEDDAGRPDPAGLAVHRLPHPGFATSWFETLWMLVWLPLLVRRTRPDILFCAGNTYAIVAVVMRVLLGARCPVIVAKISNDLDRRDLPLAVRWFYHLWCRLQGRAIDRFVVMSEAMRGEACERLVVAVARVDVVPNPVLTDREAAELAAAGRAARLRRDTTPGAGRRFLTVGRLEPQKNLPLLIRAFARGAAPEDRLVIVGEGGERRRLERLVARHGLAGRVTLPGYSPVLREWIAVSDVLVLSSDYEGLPAVLVEALAADMPIIATDCCRSMRETLAGVRHAQLVPVRDEAALARALSDAALPSPAELGLVDTARFRVDVASRGYRHAFASVLASRPRPALAAPFPLPTDGADLVFPRHYPARSDLAPGGSGAA